MTERKTSEAQLKANKAYYENNKEHASYLKKRSSARSFVRHNATKEDIEELIEIFNNENPNAK
ncbi:hypothetical protein [Gemella massiliensis]|uniref:hypothetical protein n=1 Tax=Gemella massiliensis TaxID=1909670 RepID=UPI0009302699|nr:hypothetical protein [Gemella massiliensis]